MVDQSSSISFRESIFRRQRDLTSLVTAIFVGLCPILIFATFIVLNPLREARDTDLLRTVLLVDLIYILALTALITTRVARMIAARRARSAGSRLHLRLTFVFSVVALIPTVLVAIFATININMGLEGWFSDRVRLALRNSVDAAQAYAQEHRDDLIEDAQILANALNLAKRANFFISDGDLRQLLSREQDQIQRGLSEAYIIDGSGNIRARGDKSYLFDFEPLDSDILAQISSGAPILVEDQEINEFRLVLKLAAYVDRYLYVTRQVDGQILALLDDTQKTVQFYHQLEAERGRLLFEFSLFYLGFAAILILAAVWLGLWFAERLSKPVGQLAGAAQRIGHGDLNVRVPEERGDDEIAMLGRLFNQMTRQLKGQRDALVETHTHTEQRRRLFDSVLSSVTAGVIGLDAQGRIDFMNPAAQRLLLLEKQAQDGHHLSSCVPEFAALFEKFHQSKSDKIQEELRLKRKGKLEILLVRMTRRLSQNGTLEGYVVTLDDVTDLVTAQRLAAWGDVAQRIAHEIKNPLTPIRLSSERLKRKLIPKLTEDDSQTLQQHTDVIVRQTDDLKRIVDEFSRFARMPQPDRQPLDLVKLLRDTVALQSSAFEHIEITQNYIAAQCQIDGDETMLGQAFTNLIKNAGESIIALQEAGGAGDHQALIDVNLKEEKDTVKIYIVDTGIGLPDDRVKLFEPYVTTRAKGTGLGLSIVKKIIEEHGGTLELLDAPPLETNRHCGAQAIVTLPKNSLKRKTSKE